MKSEENGISGVKGTADCRLQTVDCGLRTAHRGLQTEGEMKSKGKMQTAVFLTELCYYFHH